MECNSDQRRNVAIKRGNKTITAGMRPYYIYIYIYRAIGVFRRQNSIIFRDVRYYTTTGPAFVRDDRTQWEHY